MTFCRSIHSSDQILTFWASVFLGRILDSVNTPSTDHETIGFVKFFMYMFITDDITFSVAKGHDTRDDGKSDKGGYHLR
uniref:Secreted protein n=1 Tax=Steinernema glaseri TaxID=37863 RepID=A0A1I8AJN2_9BILA